MSRRVSKPPLFRPWSKKRGQRILGNTLRGVVGEAFFYAGLFLLGVFGLALVLIQRFAPEQSPGVSSETLSFSLAAWIFGTLSLAAIISGTAGLVFRLMRLSASHERRSAMTSRAGTRDRGAASADEIVPMPHVPQGRLLTDSPGEWLKYRLATNSNPADRLAGPAVLTLLWNAVWFVLLAVVIEGFFSARPRWIVTGLLLPFGYIGLWSFRFFLSQLRQFAGVGPTIVEIDDHPLIAGESYALFVCQRGRLRLKRLRVQLICEEETFFRQGTDVRVERAEVFRLLIHRASDVRVDPNSGWEQQLAFDLPENAMHSFVGSHNALRWKIVVNGECRPWPSFSRSFPVVVHPSGSPPRRSPR